MIVDIGGVPLILPCCPGRNRLQYLLAHRGRQIDEAIIRYVRREYNLMIGDRTAEELKVQVGTAWVTDKTGTGLWMFVVGIY